MLIVLFSFSKGPPAPKCRPQMRSGIFAKMLYYLKKSLPPNNFKEPNPDLRVPAFDMPGSVKKYGQKSAFALDKTHVLR